MREVSNSFKKAIKKYGRQIDIIITYTENGVDKLLDTNTLFSVTPIVKANLLKSVMKQLNFESSVKVPKDTWINVQFGVLIDLGLSVQDINKMKVNRFNSLQVKDFAFLQGFEYVNLGDYLVAEEPEYNADTLSYSHKCFDKMIYSMQNYESLNVTYPISIKNYLNVLANKINITLKQSNFYNQNREIQNELYLDSNGNTLGYTYRDVLDEIAQATGSIIRINSNNELEISYLNETNETIDEDFLKNINVSFAEKYGAINTIVLSRSGGADNIYYPNELPQNPIEIKIQDNQIMNWNDRSDYLPELYEALNGIEYYINDFSSTGITYLEVGDKYNIKIGENIYNCVLLNDEIDITQGLEEQINTDMPEQSETDYKKADKTDRKINQTTFIVDKQNQKIEGIISQIGDRSQKTTTITADIDGINSRVEDIEDLTNEVNGIKAITLENCIQGSLLELHIYGNNTVFDYLYPENDLYPANDLYSYGDSRIIVTNENGSSKMYELGITEVLRQNGNIKDEYILEESKAKVIRRINKNGTIKSNETIEDLGEFHIDLQEGINTITIKNYTAQLKGKYAIKSDYTKVFATQVQMNSSIKQTAQEINLEVSKKVGNDEVISKINQSAEAVTIDANKIGLQANDVLNILSNNTINLTSKNLNISSNNFNVDNNGNMSCGNANISGTITSNNATITGGSLLLNGASGNQLVKVQKNNSNSTMSYLAPDVIAINNGSDHVELINMGLPGIDVYRENSSGTYIRHTGITSPAFNPPSKADIKKNFEKLENALNTIKNIDIYKYNYKYENDKEKKHIGFVIGKDYKYSEQVTSINNDGADIYSFVSLCCKAIQEQQEQIEQLKQEIINLKGGKS